MLCRLIAEIILHVKYTVWLSMRAFSRAFQSRVFSPPPCCMQDRSVRLTMSSVVGNRSTASRSWSSAMESRIV